MSELARQTCVTCSHLGAMHVLPRGKCRLNGCPCQEYRVTVVPEREDDGSEAVVIRVPKGFVLNMQLVPMEVSDGS